MADPSVVEFWEMKWRKFGFSGSPQSTENERYAFYKPYSIILINKGVIIILFCTCAFQSAGMGLPFSNTTANGCHFLTW